MATPSVQELLQKITTLEGENATLTTSLGEANQKVTDLQASLSAETLKVTELEGKLTAANAATAAETAKVVEIQGKLTTAEASIVTLKSEAKTAEQRGQEIAAQFGGKAGKKAANSAENDGNGADIIEQLEAITDPSERTAFYKKNKQAIFAAAKLRK